MIVLVRVGSHGVGSGGIPWKKLPGGTTTEPLFDGGTAAPSRHPLGYLFRQYPDEYREWSAMWTAPWKVKLGLKSSTT